jgi:hypothetical protein
MARLFPFQAHGGNSFAHRFTGQEGFLLGPFGYGLAVFSRVGGAVIYARGKIPHYRLSATDEG